MQFVNQINNTTSTNNNSANPTLPNNNQPNGNTTTNSGNNLPNNNTSTTSTSSSSNTNSTVNTGTGSVNSTPQIQIKNANQNLIFDQMAASIDLKDIWITPVNSNDKFEVKLILTDKNGNPVKGAMITKGETKDGKYRSNYDEKTGIWQIVENFDPDDDKHITGTPALVDAKTANSLLQGNAIHALDKFKPQDFAINVYVRDVTNNQIYNNQIQADYQCMEIPDDLVKSMVRDQKSEVNKTLVMNFVNYLKDPRDRRFIGAEFKLMQAIRNDTIDPISNDSLLQIRKFNQSTFEISANKTGNYTMDFSLEQCNKFMQNRFNLEFTKNIPDNTSIGSNSNNLGSIILASIGDGANDNNKNYSKKIMKNTLKTITLLLSILLITSLVNFGEVRAEEVRKEQNKKELQNQKITYTKAEEEAVLKKIDDLNKNPSLDYGKYLTRREMLIRLEMMKKKKEYDMGWYERMMKKFNNKLSDEDIDCGLIVHIPDECASQKLLPKISQEKIISILINHDDYCLDDNNQDCGNLIGSEQINIGSLDPMLLSILLFGIYNYVDYQDAGKLYRTDELTGNEIYKMINNRLILNRFRLMARTYALLQLNRELKRAFLE